MAQIENRDNENSFIRYLNRKDEALEAWLKQRLPLVHRFTQWGANRVTSLSPLGVGLWFILVLLLLISAFWLGH